MKRFLGKIRMGDCLSLMKKIPKGKIQAFITDPPYNASSGGVNLPNNTTGGAYYKVNEKWDKFEDDKEYLDFTQRWIKEADRLLVDNGSILSCASFHNLGEILSTLKKRKYKIINIITWQKTNAMPSITHRMLTHSTEFVIWGVKGRNWIFNYEDMKKYNNGKQLRDVWKFPLCQGIERIRNSNGRATHPTQKPLKLVERLVKMATDEGDIVIDPFIGIGTTAIASISLNRKWIGIERNKVYVEKARKRIYDYKNQNNKV